MTRKKVKLAFITNDSARKATFKKRKKGLMKKGSPPHLGAVQEDAGVEQSKKMVNQESFIRQRIAKASEHLKKQHKENREKEITEVMYQCLMGKGLQNLMMPDLNDLGWLLDQNLKEIYRRIDEVKKTAPPPPPQHQVAPAAPPPPVAVAPPPLPQITTSNLYMQEQKPAVDFTMDAMQRPQWFTDWMNNPSDNQQINSFGHGDEMMLTFSDNNHNTMWSNAFFT
ncbi:agamous-like MADS-box AGL80 [Olea europaea subsp. europaea]|uniref:Agamous-like MADS-box AGL80 n=1 Tax=Olea europaea subsp. europaea TaxID=158383 RepID=A0A8S0SFY3_OLEEU|nr:agamous-like MADS-box AGL80 [Olea europaea subsp. europaea]